MVATATEPKNAGQLDDFQTVAVFETNNGARLARDALLAAGIPSTSIHVIDRIKPQPVGSQSSPSERAAALLETLGSLFSRSENARQFHLADDPAHAILVLDRRSEADRLRALEILNASNPVELYRSA